MKARKKIGAQIVAASILTVGLAAVFVYLLVNGGHW